MKTILFGDGNGLPPHSVAVIVDGGDADGYCSGYQEGIKAWTATHGTTSVTVPINTATHVIKFSRSSGCTCLCPD